MLLVSILEGHGSGGGVQLRAVATVALGVEEVLLVRLVSGFGNEEFFLPALKLTIALHLN